MGTWMPVVPLYGSTLACSQPISPLSVSLMVTLFLGKAEIPRLKYGKHSCISGSLNNHSDQGPWLLLENHNSLRVHARQMHRVYC
ncbi:hypothetical protein I79_011164 [Cricetulus griseus]|uniref:Uncharacterized protein n=1 Tax=Cricetulus griseus TaxID=10029 RepID=G3HKE4_CRIGR|nr:hypothetical protein I79_011164 [Cricetulus griseus]